MWRGPKRYCPNHFRGGSIGSINGIILLLDHILGHKGHSTTLEQLDGKTVSIAIDFEADLSRRSLWFLGLGVAIWIFAEA
jgi:hypothetical protein